MADLSNYLAGKLRDHVLRGIPYTAPATIYFTLCSVAPTKSSTGSTITEVGSITREGVTANSTNFPVLAVDSAENDVPISFTNASGSNWIAVGVAALDASTNGNMLFFKVFSSRTIANTDSITIGASGLTVQFT